MHSNRLFYKVYPLIILAFLTLLAACLLGYLFLHNNIHTVIPQQVYRSAQLTPYALKQLMRKEKIRSVINLRGSHSTREWYNNQLSIVKSNGATQYNLALHAHGLPSKQQLTQLITILQTASKPILIHCFGGSDRTGLASATALILNNKTDKATIKKQYSYHYLAIDPSSTGKVLFPYYFQWLKQNQQTLSKGSFLQWAHSAYDKEVKT